MSSLNRILLIGRAGKDCELRYLANGTAQGSFSLAVDNNRKNAAGEWEKETTWFSVVVWKDLAERCSSNVGKGKELFVEGRMQQRSWQGDDGVKHERWEVVASTVQVLGGSGEHRAVAKPQSEDWGSGDWD